MRNILQVLQITLKLMTKRDKYFSFLSILIQISMSFLDLIGLFMLGVVGVIITSGTEGVSEGGRIEKILLFFGLAESSQREVVSVLGLFAATLLISKSLFSFYFSKRILEFFSRRSAFISGSLIEKVFKIDLVAFQKRPIHRVIYGLTDGVQAFVLRVYAQSLLSLSDLILIILYSVGLFVTDWRMATVSLMFFVALAGALYLANSGPILATARTSVNATLGSKQRISEFASLFREIHVMNRRKEYVKELAQLQLDGADAQAKNVVRVGLNKYVVEVAMILALVLFGFYQFSTQSTERALGVLSIFFLATTRLVPSILRFQQILLGIKVSAISAEPTLELIRDLEENYNGKDSSFGITARETMNSAEVKNTEIIITVKDLSFRYPGSSDNTLSNLSFDIRRGEHIGIVGPTGSGKSTLVDCITGVIRSYSGAVLIEGLPPNTFIEGGHGAIGYVPQNVGMLTGTLRDNLRIQIDSRDEADQDIVNAMNIAQLHELMDGEYPLNKVIGPSFRELSGGERQRLGIARAIFRQPKILILDEATSSLDGATEISVIEGLSKLGSNCTIIAIAHRLSTIKNVDRLMYLDTGQIRAFGTLEEVTAVVPEFRNLIQNLDT
jgi:ABC-type multidrug transport system fused ATPase/permease subunit